MSDLKGISKTLWPPLTSRQWDKLPEPTKKSFNTRWEGIVKAITKLETERDALAAEVERLGKEVERWNALEAERAEWLRKTIGSAGLEHFVREWKDLKDERDRYMAALEKIADYPPGHWRFDCKDFADCIDISRKALELEGTSHD